MSGVVILHLLLVPGAAFLAGGVTQETQLLAPQTDLNHSLLVIGCVLSTQVSDDLSFTILTPPFPFSVLAILLPTVTFVALNSSALSVTLINNGENATTALSDSVREKLLRMSRGLAVILIIVLVYLLYVCFLTNS